VAQGSFLNVVTNVTGKMVRCLPSYVMVKDAKDAEVVTFSRVGPVA
jgi:hypothetical protein